ncbi:MAG: hypothetical protein QXJ14_03515 [Candidatus Aenigmatarchaeota archaeon]
MTEITTIEEYLQKSRQQQNEKVVELPSGAKFLIRKLKARELILAKVSIPIDTYRNIIYEKDTQKQLITTISPEQQKEIYEFLDTIICLAVKSPKIVKNENEDGLNINEITDEDYNKLVEEILSFSFSNKENLQFFRENQTASIT